MQGIKKVLYLLLISQIVHSLELTGAIKDEIVTPKVRILLGLDATARHKNVENLTMRLLFKKKSIYFKNCC